MVSSSTPPGAGGKVTTHRESPADGFGRLRMFIESFTTRVLEHISILQSYVVLLSDVSLLKKGVVEPHLDSHYRRVTGASLAEDLKPFLPPPVLSLFCSVDPGKSKTLSGLREQAQAKLDALRARLAETPEQALKGQLLGELGQANATLPAEFQALTELGDAEMAVLAHELLLFSTDPRMAAPGTVRILEKFKTKSASSIPGLYHTCILIRLPNRKVRVVMKPTVAFSQITTVTDKLVEIGSQKAVKVYGGYEFEWNPENGQVSDAFPVVTVSRIAEEPVVAGGVRRLRKKSPEEKTAELEALGEAAFAGYRKLEYVVAGHRRVTYYRRYAGPSCKWLKKNRIDSLLSLTRGQQLRGLASFVDDLQVHLESGRIPNDFSPANVSMQFKRREEVTLTLTDVVGGGHTYGLPKRYAGVDSLAGYMASLRRMREGGVISDAEFEQICAQFSFDFSHFFLTFCTPTVFEVEGAYSEHPFPDAREKLMAVGVDGKHVPLLAGERPIPFAPLVAELVFPTAPDVSYERKMIAELRRVYSADDPTLVSCELKIQQLFKTLEGLRVRAS